MKICTVTELGGLGARYAVHLWLIGKLVGNFLWIITELFSLGAFVLSQYMRLTERQTDRISIARCDLTKLDAHKKHTFWSVIPDIWKILRLGSFPRQNKFCGSKFRELHKTVTTTYQYAYELAQQRQISIHILWVGGTRRGLFQCCSTVVGIYYHGILLLKSTTCN